MVEKSQPTAYQVIKRYFESNGRRAVTFDELRALTAEQRDRLAIACARALGVSLQPARPE